MEKHKGISAQKVAVIVVFFVIVIALAYGIDKQPTPMADTPMTGQGAALAVDVPLQHKPMNNQEQSAKNFSHQITLATSKGAIIVETYDADAPKAVNNFLTLASKNYYHGVIFHRVIKGFMIQGGDPNCAANPLRDTGVCGTGGPGYKFADELGADTVSAKEGYRRGVVAMANAGPNTNGSQFFIMHKDYPLPHNYTIFGKVVLGQEVVDAIAETPVGRGDRPKQAVTIMTVTVKSK